MLNKKILLKIFTIISFAIPYFSYAENIYQNNTYYGGNTYQVSGHTYYGNKPSQSYNSNNNSNIQMNRTSSNNSTQINNSTKTASVSTTTDNNGIYYVKGNVSCFDKAAAFHNVDPWLLVAIASVESGFNPNAINKNKNGSYDVGMMQINSIWLPTLRKKGIDPSLLKNACASTFIGAWILSDNIRRYGYNWRAIGAYNSANPRIGLIYAKKVYAAHAKILAKVMNYR